MYLYRRLYIPCVSAVKYAQKSEKKTNTNERTEFRRNFLKGVSGVAAFLMAPAASAKEQEKNINSAVGSELSTDFDPSSDSEVASFIKESFKHDEEVEKRVRQFASDENVRQTRNEIVKERREELLEELDEQQLEAVGEAMKESELVLETASSQPGIRLHNSNPETTPDTQPDDTGQPLPIPEDSTNETEYEVYEASATVKPKIRVTIPGCPTVPIGGCNPTFEKTAFEWEHNLEWSGNDDWPPDIRNVSAYPDPQGKSYLLINWDYQGIDYNDHQIKQDGNYLVSKIRGTFNRSVLLKGGFTSVGTDTIFTEMYGNFSGKSSHTGTKVNGEER